MLKDLIKIAGELDALGFNREADIVDALIRKVAVPLADVAEWKTGDANVELTDREFNEGKESRRGVGSGLSSKDVGVAKWIMRESPGNWVFVIPDNINNIEEKINSKSFKDWLKEKLYGEDHWVFVVGAAPLKGDYKDPYWMVHDLVGHSAGNRFIKYNTWGIDKDFISAIDKIWELLPPELQNAKENFDRVFDISAAIILFKGVTLEWSLGVISSVETDDMEDLTNGITLMFDSAQRWLVEQKWVYIGGNKVSIIKPWE